jgi:hypothetical protein
MSRSSVLFEPLEVRALFSAGVGGVAEFPGGAGAAVLAAPAAGASATPEPSQGGTTFTEYAGVKFTDRLGEFHFKTADQRLTAVIDWGDGTHSDGKVVGSYATGERYVNGTHTYSRTGTYAITVKVYAAPIGAPPRATDPVAQFTSVANIKTLRPSPGGLRLTETAGKQFTARLGEFTKKVVDLSLDAVISWGDGTHSAGKLVGSYATGEYYVEGTHTYARSGTYKVDVKVYTHPVGSPILPTQPVARFRSVMKVVDPG